MDDQLEALPSDNEQLLKLKARIARLLAENEALMEKMRQTQEETEDLLRSRTNEGPGE